MEEKMNNRPCLDMNKAVEMIKAYAQLKGYDGKELVEVLKKAFIGWFSRSIASSVFVFCKDTRTGKWCVLASERGEDAADYKGYWNCPCGYLDFDETTANAARRECFEETGVNLNINDIKFIGFEDDPVTANRQNVTFRYVCVIEDKTTDDFTFSHANNEGKEVGRIMWIPIDQVDNYAWAFGHRARIGEIFNEHVDPDHYYRDMMKRKAFWKKIKDFFYLY